MSKIRSILQELLVVLDRPELEGWEEITELLLGRRIFVVGEGRSGLMGKSFAMRLMHLGAEVYVVGETITPSIASEDVLIAVSGSGTTKQVVWSAIKAKEQGSTVVAVTTDRSSQLGVLADNILHIPAATKYRKNAESKSIQPLGSLFDQSAHILFDAICLQYASVQSEDNDSAQQRHSNME
jgi:6-phospho-3-hexuloisomerase